MLFADLFCIIWPHSVCSEGLIMASDGQHPIKNKTVLITGATSGIGQATAASLAACGARLVLVARHEGRAHATKKQLIQQSNNQNIHVLMADLSSQASIRQLAQNYIKQFDRLDVLINNAGGMWNQRRLTVDNLEQTFAVDHLAYFLLTNLLIEPLKQSAPSRIINVSSGLQASARLDFENLQGEKHYSAFKAYGQAKLANVMFTYELARRLKGTDITANCLHPGVVRTRFGHDGGWLYKLMFALFFMLMSSPQKGATTSVYLATSPEVEKVTGKYFDHKRAVATNPQSYDETLCKKLWDISAQLTGLTTTV